MKKQRTILIGDVHGCFDSLQSILKKVKLNVRKDKIIFLGDYFDRGLQSFEVYEKLCQLKKKMGDRCVLIRGNHEVMLLDFLSIGDITWTWNHCDVTINSFRNHGVSLHSVAEWIKKNTVLYYEDEKFDVCHAGRCAETFQKEKESVLIWDRSAFQYGLWDGKTTFVGHTPLVKPFLSDIVCKIYKYNTEYDLPAFGLVGIDTGCVFGDRLTAAIVEENKMRFVCVENPLTTDSKTKKVSK